MTLSVYSVNIAIYRRPSAPKASTRPGLSIVGPRFVPPANKVLAGLLTQASALEVEVSTLKKENEALDARGEKSGSHEVATKLPVSILELTLRKIIDQECQEGVRSP